MPTVIYWSILAVIFHCLATWTYGGYIVATQHRGQAAQPQAALMPLVLPLIVWAVLLEALTQYLENL